MNSYKERRVAEALEVKGALPKEWYLLGIVLKH